MPQLGASRITAAYSTNGLSDASGIPLMSSSNDFGASPLGIAARSQALYGIANAQFNLLPEDPTSQIADNQNPLPYWSVMEYSDGRIVPLSFYDTATGTYSVELNPTAGSASDYIEVKTRSYLLTDDNLGLRQKAFLTMSKGTAYAGTTQFNVVLNAEYFDVNGTSLSTYDIGTALDNTAMTSITGITTSGSAAINAAAAYVDFTITLTATATVTSGVKVYLKSFVIATSTAATGSFRISQTFTSSGTWTRPSGVDYVDLIVLSGGQGGGRGEYFAGTANTTPTATGAAGASPGAGWAYLRDLYVGDVGSVSVGIGAGGAGAPGTVITKGQGSSTQYNVAAANGSSGGATTFGSYLSYAAPTPAGATAALTYPYLSVGGTIFTNATSLGSYLGVPYTTLTTAGNAGGAGSASASVGTIFATGAAGTILGNLSIGQTGGQGGNAQISTVGGVTVTAGSNASGGGAGAGSGGAASGNNTAGTGTFSAKSGAGGDAIANTGANGGSSGGVCVRAGSSVYSDTVFNIDVGKGGDGAAGFLTVIWVG